MWTAGKTRPWASARSGRGRSLPTGLRLGGPAPRHDDGRRRRPPCTALSAGPYEPFAPRPRSVGPVRAEADRLEEAPGRQVQGSTFRDDPAGRAGADAGVPWRRPARPAGAVPRRARSGPSSAARTASLAQEPVPKAGARRCGAPRFLLGHRPARSGPARAGGPHPIGEDHAGHGPWRTVAPGRRSRHRSTSELLRAQRDGAGLTEPVPDP